MIRRQKQVTEDDNKKKLAQSIDTITQLNLVKVEIEATHERDGWTKGTLQTKTKGKQNKIKIECLGRERLIFDKLYSTE